MTSELRDALRGFSRLILDGGADRTAVLMLADALEESGDVPPVVTAYMRTRLMTVYSHNDVLSFDNSTEGRYEGYYVDESKIVHALTRIKEFLNPHFQEARTCETSN